MKPVVQQHPTRTGDALEEARGRLLLLVEPAEAERWLATAHPSLGGETPGQALLHGQEDRVLEMIARIEEGIYI
jgi:hypothetical protein